MLLGLVVTVASAQILTLTPSLSVSERYDDNIFQTDTATETDFITSVIPGIFLRYVPSPPTEITFDYRTNFEFFAENEAQNQISQRGVLRLAAPLLSFLSVTLRDTFILTEEPGERVLEIEEVTGLRPVSEQRRARTVRNRTDATLSLQFFPRLTLDLLFASLLSDVDVPDEVDEFRYRIGVDLGYLTDVARRSRLSVAYEVTFHTFSANAAGSTRSDFDVHTITARFHHALSPTLSTDAAVGYAFTVSDDPALDGDTSPTANIRLVKTLREGEATFSYQHQLTAGGGEGGVVTTDVLTLAFSLRISPRITARLGSNLSFFDFEEASLRRGGDRIFVVVRPGLTYQILRFLSLAVDYAFEYTNFTEDDPHLDFANRQDHRLTFTARLSLRNWLFLALTYTYTSRRFAEVTVFRGAEAFERNQFTLTLTTAPTFRF